MKKIVLSMFVVMGVLMGGSGLALAAPTDAARNQVCDGINGQTGGNCAASTSGLEISNVVKVVLNILSIVAGVAAVIMVVVAGLRYTLSAGDANSISAAKKTLVYALVGLAIVALSQFIVRFVMSGIN